MDWISVNDKLPSQTVPVFVAAWEFGCRPEIYLARMWQSSLPNQQPVWYLYEKAYGLERPYQIASVVRYWMPIPAISVDDPKKNLK
jgi:hypothetical protein